MSENWKKINRKVRVLITMMAIITVSMLVGCKTQKEQQNDKSELTTDSELITTEAETQKDTLLTEVTEETATVEETMEEETATALSEDTESQVVETEISESLIAAVPAEETVSDSEDDILADLDGLTFIFSSGAGGWSTEVDMSANGVFSGYYHDSEMGSVGEGYPNGTVYVCYFDGKFTVKRKIDDFTYALELEEFNIQGELEEESIQDEIKYINTDAYGFDNVGEFLLYLPGRQTEDLPEEFLSWVGMRQDIPATLPFYGLYNVGGETGFSGW